MNFTDFPIGPFTFSTGGLVFLLGIIGATWMLIRTVHEESLSLSFLHNNLLLFAAVSFIFGRLGSVGKFWSYFESGTLNTSFLERIGLFIKKFFLFWHGAVDTLWSAIGFLATLLLLTTFKKENVWKWLDAFTLPTILLLIFWNLGAFFSAWDYGKPVSDSFWFGVTYNVQQVRYSVPVHPVQIYAFLYYTGLFVYGLKWWRSKKFQKAGVFFGVLALLVFLGNGCLEFFRGDPVSMVRIMEFEIRLPQLVSFVLILASAIFLVFRTHPEILHHEHTHRPLRK